MDRSHRDFVIGDFVQKSGRSKEGIENIRDSPSRHPYPGQMDEGFGRVGARKTGEQRTANVQSCIVVMWLEDCADKVIQLNEATRESY